MAISTKFKQHNLSGMSSFQTLFKASPCKGLLKAGLPGHSEVLPHRLWDEGLLLRPDFMILKDH